MSILLNKDSKIIVQGITGRDGSFHTGEMLRYGTKIVGGVTPGKLGRKEHGLPVFDTVSQAVAELKPDATCVFVPPRFAIDAVWESIESGIGLIVIITEGLPSRDLMEAKSYASGRGIVLIGPNCPGIITPEESKVGIMPGHIFKKGNVGVISRSGTLTYEVVHALTQAGMGQSTVIGIGGDPIIGSRFLDLLKLFKDDPDTHSVALIGEIGGSDEYIAAEYIKNEFGKPAVTFIAGKTAPEGKKMGHAGAIVAGKSDSAQAKIAALSEMGISVAELPQDIPELLEKCSL
ncbi:succinate--CoA ligase subunit alpha [bacterium]|nr:succinate--CoA ligase subunit alpha [bacterium]